MLIVFAPIPYVDVTSSWRCASKYQRIMVSAAGMYSEILLAAVAAIIWVHADPGMISQQSYNVMITASLTTVLFNANPLMRFDGYYMLADFVEIPNLYSLAQQSLIYLGKRYVMGVKTRAPQLGRLETVVRLGLRGRVVLVASTRFGVHPADCRGACSRASASPWHWSRVESGLSRPHAD